MGATHSRAAMGWMPRHKLKPASSPEGAIAARGMPDEQVLACAG